MVWTAYEYTADDCIPAAGELLDESISRPDSGLESVYMKDEEAVRKRNPNHCFSMLISIK